MNRRRLSLLIIEHDPRDRDQILSVPALGAMIDGGTALVHHSSTLEDAELALRGNSSFDLVICDLFFPHANESSCLPADPTAEPLCRLLQEAKVPVIAISRLLTTQLACKLVEVLRPIGLVWKARFVPDLDRVLRSALSQLGFPEPRPNELTWLHISDLHYGYVDAGGAHNRAVVESAFFRDLQRQVDAGVQFDRVFVTGDLGNTGSAAEFRNAFDFLKRVGATVKVEPASFYVVPGNHDLARGDIDGAMRAIKPPESRDELQSTLFSPSQRSTLVGPFKAFREALGDFHRDDASRVAQADLAFVAKDEARKVAIVGLNSALASGLALVNGQVHDKGRLFLGERRLDELLRGIDPAWFCIALVHHPLDYLADFDKQDACRLLTQRCDLVLHGHLHVNEFEAYSNMHRALPLIPCGSVYQGRSLANSYNIATVDLDTRRIEVRYRRYSDLRQEFLMDIDTTGEDRGGRFATSLPRRAGIGL